MIPEEGFYQADVIPWNGGHTPTEELVFFKKKVIPFLLNHPYSGPFRYPVNAKAEGIYPDYFKVSTMGSVELFVIIYLSSYSRLHSFCSTRTG